MNVSNEERIKEILGPQNYKLLLDKCDANAITVQKLVDILRFLHPSVTLPQVLVNEAGSVTRQVFREVLSDLYDQNPKSITTDQKHNNVSIKI